jgi:hypothetical protein
MHNLPHFARAELGVKLKHFFQEKGLENQRLPEYYQTGVM